MCALLPCILQFAPMHPCTRRNSVSHSLFGAALHLYSRKLGLGPPPPCFCFFCFVCIPLFISLFYSIQFYLVSLSCVPSHFLFSFLQKGLRGGPKPLEALLAQQCCYQKRRLSFTPPSFIPSCRGGCQETPNLWLPCQPSSGEFQGQLHVSHPGYHWGNCQAAWGNCHAAEEGLLGQSSGHCHRQVQFSIFPFARVQSAYFLALLP